MGKHLKAVLLLAAISLLLLPQAIAEHPSQGAGYGSGCPTKGGGKSECPILGKFFKKAHMILKNKEELGLTDAQYDEIKDLKLQAKKAKIQQKADKELFILDVDAKLREEAVDLDQLKEMIDEGFESMSDGVKSSAEMYVELKNVLTNEQKAKLKSLWKAKKHHYSDSGRQWKDRSQSNREYRIKSGLGENTE